MRILLAYDGSKAAEAALEEIQKRPWPAGSEVLVVTAIEPPIPLPAAGESPIYAPALEKLMTTLREETHGRARRLVDRLASRSSLKASYAIREGAAKDALLEAIEEWRPDLVIVGSRGTTLLGRVFLGSVALALATHAPCNVEIVKIPAAR
jgi:nucleotide-binding universal stress UspA family protein